MSDDAKQLAAYEAEVRRKAAAKYAKEKSKKDKLVHDKIDKLHHAHELHTKERAEAQKQREKEEADKYDDATQDKKEAAAKKKRKEARERKQKETKEKIAAEKIAAAKKEKGKGKKEVTAADKVKAKPKKGKDLANADKVKATPKRGKDLAPEKEDPIDIAKRMKQKKEKETTKKKADSPPPPLKKEAEPEAAPKPPDYVPSEHPEHTHPKAEAKLEVATQKVQEIEKEIVLLQEQISKGDFSNTKKLALTQRQLKKAQALQKHCKHGIEVLAAKDFKHDEKVEAKHRKTHDKFAQKDAKKDKNVYTAYQKWKKAEAEVTEVQDAVMSGDFKRVKELPKLKKKAEMAKRKLDKMEVKAAKAHAKHYTTAGPVGLEHAIDDKEKTKASKKKTTF
jgi:hypothetical protein